MSKYIRWQVLLTWLGIVLIAALIYSISLGREATSLKTLAVSTPTVPANEPTAVVQMRGGRYVEGIAGYPQLINPLFSLFNDVDRDLCVLIFEGLTSVDERNQVVPLLAERWDVSSDGLNYTFHLRRDVRWQDGEPFTADDVTFTFGLLQSPDFPVAHAHAELWRSVQMSKVDTYTVQFVLSEPYAPFLDYTTTGIVPKHILESVPLASLMEHSFNVAPVGAGLFKLKELDQTHIVLETNPFHRLWGQAMLDEIEFKFYPTDRDAFAAYEAGQVMGVSRISTQDLASARANPDLQLLSARLSGYSLIFLNLQSTDRPFLQDQRVRQALLYALDRQALVDRVLGGQGIVIHGPIMSQSWAYNPQIKQYPHDLDKAISLLEQAGFELPDPRQVEVGDVRQQDALVRIKKDQRLEFTLLVDTDPDQVALANMIAEQWTAAGVRATVQAVSISNLAVDYLQPRQFDAVLLQWPAQLDPDPYPVWHETQIKSPGQNYSGLEDRDASEAIEVARQLTDRGERARLYIQFQDIFAEKVPALALYQPIYTYGVDRQVRNVQIAPMLDPSGRFRNIWQWAPLEKEMLLRDWNDQVGDQLDKDENSWYDSRRQ